MIKNLDAIEAALGLKAGDFKAAYDDKEEKEIDITGLAILKKDELETLRKNERENAAVAAVEVTIKKAREKYNLDFTGKNIDAFAEALKTKALEEAKVEPTKKVQELTSDFNKMKANYEEEVQKRTTLEATFKQKDAERTIDSAIMSKLPDGLVIPKDDVLNIIKAKNKISINDKGAVVFLDSTGEIMKNSKTLDPLSVDEVLPNLLTPYVKPVSGGGGGKDNPAQAKAGSFEAFDKEMADAGVSQHDEKYKREMQKRLADKTLVM